ncbi:MAG: C13 family peptidase, partial [Steroidobacterales bacterium]
VIIEGLGGEPRYTQQFDAQVKAARAAAESMTPAAQIEVLSGEAATRAAIRLLLRQLAGKLRREDRLLLYLIGHGSYDGVDYKFNIPGPDITGRELAGLLNGLPAEQQVIVCTGSASGALLEPLKSPTRVVITATRSGSEKNATRFGDDFVAALTDAAADTDKSGAISAKEAFDYAARRVKDYFEHETQLATEHPTLAGERAARFTIAQLQGATEATPEAASTAQAPDSALARERAALNSQIEELRLRKDRTPEAEYSAQLENLLLQLASVQQRIDGATGGGGR